MSRRDKSGLLVAIIAAIVAGFMSGPLWANTEGRIQQVSRRPLSYDAVRRIRARYPSLLANQRLRNDYTAHYMHVKQTLKTVTSANMSAFGSAPGSVTFRKVAHPRPYATQAEDNALFKLGVLAGFGHFAIVNANVPEMKDNATSILQTLSKIATDTQLTDLTAELGQISQAVNDPGFTGGPSKTLERYDAFVTRLADRVLDIYTKDGFWYYTTGMTLAGITAIPGKDLFNAPYFRDMLALLYNNRPYYDIPYGARIEMANISHSDWHFHNPAVNQDRAMRAIMAMYKM